MKTLLEHIQESLLDANLIDSESAVILDFIMTNYRLHESMTVGSLGNPLKIENFRDSFKIKKDTVNFEPKWRKKITLQYIGKNTTLTNGLFKWGLVDGDFSFSKGAEDLSECPAEVTGSVRTNATLKSLKGRLKKVGEDFQIGDASALTSLAGSIVEVGGAYMVARNKNLKSLKGMPKTVGSLRLDDLGIKDLTGCSEFNGKGEGRVHVDGCDIESLRGCPQRNVNYLTAWNCKNLVSLDGSPVEVAGTVLLDNAKIPSMAGGPKRIGGDLRIQGTWELTDWTGFPEEVNGNIYVSGCALKNRSTKIKKLCKLGGKVINRFS